MTKMQVYLATSGDNRTAILLLADWLQENYAEQVEVCSTWHTREPIDDIALRGDIDLDDVKKCHTLILMYPHGFNSSGEFSYALGAGKQCIYFADPAHDEYLLNNMVHQNVTMARSVEELRFAVRDVLNLLIVQDVL